MSQPVHVHNATVTYGYVNNRTYCARCLQDEAALAPDATDRSERDAESPSGVDGPDLPVLGVQP